MRFKNSYELAEYFVKHCPDTRKWGELREFESSNSWRYYFGEMQDKYVRGQEIMKSFFSTEYQQAEKNVISDFIDFIDKRLTFPLDYECKCISANGYFTDFEVEYITDNQLSFDLSMV